MNIFTSLPVVGCIVGWWLALGEAVHGQAFPKSMATMVEDYCLRCHDADTDTPLNLEALGHDLARATTFKKWEKVYDRVARGEMPPEGKKRPPTEQRNAVLAALAQALRTENVRQHKTHGRVPARRLSRVEYEHTLHDLLGIGGALARHLPPDTPTDAFATTAARQTISPVHITSYLDAADRALDEALQLGQQPLGPTGQVRRIDDDAVMLLGRGGTLARSWQMGFRPRHAGLYRVTAQAVSRELRPMSLALHHGAAGRLQARQVGATLLPPLQTGRLSAEFRMMPGDFFYLTVTHPGAKTPVDAKVAFKWVHIAGPLEEPWPPKVTRNLLAGATFVREDSGGYNPVTPRSSHTHLAEILSRLAPRVFRRPLMADELKPFLAVGEPALRDGRGLGEAVRLSLRALLNQPRFLFHDAAPGPLESYALATRLSYFLWKSLPDAELAALAQEGVLTDTKVLAAQVDRMLADSKSDRFVDDFLDGWLLLRDIEATTPDEKLYPEFDEMLLESMLAETRLFFRELLDRDLGARHFIDSDFTFLNPSLAMHYGINGVSRGPMRRVALPLGSVRGGLLTQASILKITANGTFTSPVKRGHFVLAHLLGTPPSPPPPDIGNIEPDTRGAATVRQALAKHRNQAACAGCHRHIDPPGFALEGFDPIGGHRARYRVTTGGAPRKHRLADGRLFPIQEGPVVDASGATADGQSFQDIREFKRLLLKREEQVARHFTRQLVVYATGGKIQFADREEIERILAVTKQGGHGVRTILHEVVQSKLFRNK